MSHVSSCLLLPGWYRCSLPVDQVQGSTHPGYRVPPDVLIVCLPALGLRQMYSSYVCRHLVYHTTDATEVPVFVEISRTVDAPTITPYLVVDANMIHPYEALSPQQKGPYYAQSTVRK
jgi:hypothetical protein